MAGPSSDFTGVAQQRMAQRQALSTLELRQQMAGKFNRAMQQPAVPTASSSPLVNNGIGLLPKDLIGELLHADNIPDLIAKAIQAFQESRAQNLQPIQQPNLAGQWRETTLWVNLPPRFFGQI